MERGLLTSLISRPSNCRKRAGIEQWSHLSGIDLPDLDGSEVMLLVGSDIAHLLIHLDVCQGRRDEWTSPSPLKPPLDGPSLATQPKDGVKESMQTFLQQSQGSLCNNKLNDLGKSTLMRRSKIPQKQPCPLKTKEPW